MVLTISIIALVASALALVASYLLESTPGNSDASESRADTEFTAEVVRLVSVSPHPNADRLEIARFEMEGLGESAYEVVIQKGTAKPGDLMAYFSVDCVLPLSHPEFSFLASRLDGAGKIAYRLRAARLRGVFSQGLLVPAPAGSTLGDQLAESWGVSYYRDPEPEEKRGPTASSAAPRVQPMGVYSVDSLKKLPRLFEPGENVYVTEKIHGTNFRFGAVPMRSWFGRLLRAIALGTDRGYRFVVGSHRVIKTGAGGDWYGEDVWTEAATRMGLEAKARAFPGYVFYGELYGFTYSGKAIQPGFPYGRTPESGPGLAIFDIKGPDGKWLSPLDRSALCGAAGLTPVPLVIMGDGLERFPGWLQSFAEGVSLLDGKTQREGVVVESMTGSRKKAKYVGEGYLTRKEKKAA